MTRKKVNRCRVLIFVIIVMIFVYLLTKLKKKYLAINVSLMTLIEKSNEVLQNCIHIAS